MANKTYALERSDVESIVRNLDKVPFDNWHVKEHELWKYGKNGNYEFSTRIGLATARVINHGCAEWYLELEEKGVIAKYFSTQYLANRGSEPDRLLQDLYSKLKFIQDSRKKEEQEETVRTNQQCLRDLIQKFKTG